MQSGFIAPCRRRFRLLNEFIGSREITVKWQLSPASGDERTLEHFLAQESPQSVASKTDGKSSHELTHGACGDGRCGVCSGGARTLDDHRGQP